MKVWALPGESPGEGADISQHANHAPITPSPDPRIDVDGRERGDTGEGSGDTDAGADMSPKNRLIVALSAATVCFSAVGLVAGKVAAVVYGSLVVAGITLGFGTHNRWLPRLKKLQSGGEPKGLLGAAMDAAGLGRYPEVNDNAVSGKVYGRFESNCRCTECGSQEWELVGSPTSMPRAVRDDDSRMASEYNWKCVGCGSTRSHNPYLEVRPIDPGIPDEVAGGPPAHENHAQSIAHDGPVERAEPGEPFRADIECGECGADRWVDVDGFFDGDVPAGVKAQWHENTRCWGCLNCGNVREANPLVAEIKLDYEIGGPGDVPPGAPRMTGELQPGDIPPGMPDADGETP